MEPTKVTQKPDARAVRSKPRKYPPHKAAWVAEHMQKLERAGMVYQNNQAVYGSVAMAVPKGEDSFRMVSDYRAVNATIEQASMPMPNLEHLARLAAGAHAFCTLHTQQGY